MNANLKKVLALLTALVLLVTAAGCLEQTAPDTAADTAAEPSAEASAEPGAAAEIDYTAPAIELGGVVITVQDIADMYADYSYYMEYYGMTVDPATALAYAEESCISAFVNVWQAEEQGITLSDEEKTKLNESLEEFRQEILTDYIAYAEEQGGEEGTDFEAVALEMIEQDLMTNYGFGLEKFMESYALNTERVQLTEKVEEVCTADITVTDDEVKTWYDKTVSAQTATFEETPADYASVVLDFQTDVSQTPALVAPEGYIRIKTVMVSPEEALDEAYETNAAEMTTLEAEYGALALAVENAARQQEIKTRYAELKQANDDLYETYITAARENAGKAMAALNEGTAFDDVMKTFNTVELSEDEIAEGELLYVAAEEPAETDAALIEAVNGLADGAYSDVVKIGDDFYIVMRLGALEPGVTAFDDCKELCRDAALTEKKAAEWTAMSEQWYNEALEIAVYHKDAYAGIIN